MGKKHYKWPFSIAMLNYQRVFILVCCRVPMGTHGYHVGTHGYHVPEESGECPGGLWQCLRLPPSVPFDDGPGPCARMFYLLACDADIPSLSKQNHKILNLSPPPKEYVPSKKVEIDIHWHSTWAFVLLLPTLQRALVRRQNWPRRGLWPTRSARKSGKPSCSSTRRVWMGMGTCHAAG